MPIDRARLVAALPCMNMRVLALCQTQRDEDERWEFPSAPLREGERAMDTCKRLMHNKLGCRLSTIWLLDSRDYVVENTPVTVDCCVCVPLAGCEPSAPGMRLHWLEREDIARTQWAPPHDKIARMVGTYWDSLFQAEHL